MASSDKLEPITGKNVLEQVVTAQSEVIGHREGEPDLEKKFSVWSLGALCLCLMATWEALSTVVAQALISGGAPCLFYN